MAKTEATTGSDEPEKKKGKAGTILTYVLATLMAGGAGAGAGFLLPSDPSVKQTDAETEKAAPEKTAAHPVVVTPLTPMLTNLAHPSDVWVRLELALMGKEPLAPELVETVGQDLLAFLRTVRLSHMEGPSGFLTFRQALDDRAQFATQGKAQRVLIRTILFE